MQLKRIIAGTLLGLSFWGVLTPPAPAAVVKSKSSRQKVVATAHKQVGVPYVWGGESRRGFDCSGLVQYVYGKAGVSLPRTADRQFKYGTPVKYGQARPGDLMFFNTGGGSGQVTHVGIYMGNQHMLHAPKPGKKVQYAKVGPRSWFRPRLLGIRRVNERVFELARKPHGWEKAALPEGVVYAITDKGWPSVVDRLASAP